MNTEATITIREPYFRQSTNEWIVEVECRSFDTFYIARHGGKTGEDARLAAYQAIPMMLVDNLHNRV